MNEPKNKTDEFLYSIWNFFAASLSEKTRKNYYNVINYYLFNMLMVFIYYIVFASVYNFRWIFLNIFVINSIFILISYIKNSKDIKLFR